MGSTSKGHEPLPLLAAAAGDEESRAGGSYLARRGTFGKCLLLFSGGLDTSVMAHWIGEAYDCDVYTVTLDVGQREDFGALERKAYRLGVKKHFHVDARRALAEEFCWPAVRANATAGRNAHPLSSSLTRPLIIRHAIEVAEAEDIPVIAHGASGKSNDSLRFDQAALSLRPVTRVIAPVREWSMDRAAELAYARRHGIDVEATPERPYSIDDNLWARETEAGLLLHPDIAAPDEAFSLVPPADAASPAPEAVTIDFRAGLPSGIGGRPMPPLEMIQVLNELGTAHGIGRFDFMEDRGVGVKVRELHEAPAAEILMRAHADLQELTCTSQELRFARIAELDWAESALLGFWFTPHMDALNAYFSQAQARVTGQVTLQLHRGRATVTARTSPYALDIANLISSGFIAAVNEPATAPFIEVSGLQRRASRFMAARAGRDAA